MTDRTSYPTCPYCGVEDRDWWDYCPQTLQHDGDTSERTCGSCEADYVVTMFVDVAFQTKKLSAAGAT